MKPCRQDPGRVGRVGMVANCITGARGTANNKSTTVGTMMAEAGRRLSGGLLLVLQGGAKVGEADAT